MCIRDRAKGDEHVFTLTASGQLQVELDDLPGDIAKYYLLMDEDCLLYTSRCV